MLPLFKSYSTFTLFRTRYVLLTPSATSSKPSLASSSWPLVTLLVTTALTVGVLVSLRSFSGWIVLAGVASVPIVCVALYYPQLLTAFTLFLFFSNAPVVAMRFHGVPRIVATMAPPAALLFVWLYQMIAKRETIVISRAWPWAMALLAVEIISAMCCNFPNLALDVLKSHVIEGLGLFFILCNVVRSRLCLQQVVVALLLAGSFLGGLSLVQQITSTHLSDYGGFAQVPMEGRGFDVGNYQQRRAAGPIGEQNRYAQNMLMLLPLAIFPAFTAKSWRKLGFVMASILIAAGCILTFSRGAAVAFIMLSLVMAFSGYIRRRHLLMLGGATLLMMLAFPQLASRLDSFKTLVGYLRGDKAAYAEELDGAITGRATSMLAALRVTADYPLLGVGPGNFPFYNRKYAKLGGFRAQEEDRAAHCLYLHLASEIGLVGLGLFLAMVGVTLNGLHQVWSTHRQHDPELASLAASFAMALFAYLLTGLFLHYSFIRFFWLILALASCVTLVAGREAALREVAGHEAAAGVNE